MLILVEERVTIDSAGQLKKTRSPIEVTLAGIVTDASDVHPINAEAPMKVTLLGIVIDVIDVHPENAPEPIEVTLVGIIIVVGHEHPVKAPEDIEVSPSGMNSVSDEHPWNISLPVVGLLAVVTDVSDEH